MTSAPRVEASEEPFAHAVSASFLDAALSAKALEWLESDAPWKLRVEDFYEQHEFELSEETLPPHLHCLIAAKAVQNYIGTMVAPIAAGQIRLVGATAHRLSGGQSIRVHNDYIDGQETHRLLIQLNRGWADENGGFLMLFSSSNAEDVARVIRPVHRSAVAFEISPASYHAVSPTVRGERYTLVFSFRQEG